MRPSLNATNTQKLKHHPGLFQSAYLLQLPALSLQTEIQKLLEDNPVLEEISDFQTDTAVDYLDFSSAPTSLKAHLMWQLELSSLSALEQTVCISLIDAIQENGYLGSDLLSIQQGLQKVMPDLNLATLESALKKVQTFEPIGVAARDLKECLLIQLAHLDQAKPAWDLARQLIETQLDQLSNPNLAKLQKKFQVDRNQLEQAIDLILSLNPKPGLNFSPNTAHNLIPDLITVQKKGQWVVKLNEALLPRLKINAYYRDLNKTLQDPQPKAYLAEKIKQANWLIHSLKHRARTLLRIGACIVEKQQAFLQYGESRMMPLTLKDVANSLGLHASTVSRAVQNKSMATSRGVFGLSYFFPAKLVSQQHHYSAIQAQQMIQNQLEKNPTLTDQALAYALQKQGIAIARRTIAKYRAQLGIPTANKRKHT